MSTNKKHSIQNLFNYLRNRLSNQERYAFEKELTKDPFLEDAMDGFAQLTTDELEQDLIKLNSKLQQRIDKKKERKLIPYLRIAATVAILIGIGSVIIYINLPDISEKLIVESKDVTKDTIQIIERIPPKEARRILDEINDEPANEQLAFTENKSAKSQQRKGKQLQIEPASPKSEIVISKTLEAESIAMVEDVELSSTNEDIIVEMEQEKTMKPVIISMVASQPEQAILEKKSNKEFTFSIKGTVIDVDTKEPLPGANIIQGNNGMITDIDGNFEFIIVDDSTIQIAYIGYETREISIAELAQSNNQIEMQANQLALEEVVVEGYGVQKQSVTTGAVSKIKSKRIKLSKNKKQSKDDKTTSKSKYSHIKISYNTELENHASPAGGIKELEKHFKEHFKIESQSTLTIVLEFTVKIDGALSGFKILRSTNDDSSKKAIQLLKEDQAWEPAMINDIPIQEKVTLTITFQ